MRLVAKIPVSDEITKENLLTELTLSNSRPKGIKGGVIVDLTFKINEWIDIPNSVLDYDYVLLINVAEKGGKCGDISYAQIVCGVSGKPLKPFFLPRKNVQPCSDHAYFTLPERCYTIEASEDYENIVKIKEHTIEIDEDNNKARIRTDDVFVGNIIDLPDDLIRFKKPAQICIDKASCEECQRVFYYVDPSNIKFQQHRQKRSLEDTEEYQEAA